ncbi:MAG: CmcI family methyltransferase, partial [Acidimicrobiales bacterium]
AAARRTKPRRMSPKAFSTAATDGRPETPTPVPDELTWAFTEAVWRSLPWAKTTWLGHRLATAPTDLLAYQEMISRVRPDWIIETGTGDGGRALFLSSICELVGHGHVLSIDEDQPDDLPRHPRLQHIAGRPQDRATAKKARAIVGHDARALVILGSCGDRNTTTQEFEAYAPLVPIGSYAVVAETIVNGHPVWPTFGDGPAEAVKQILTRHGDFVHDPGMVKYSFTFNPGGYLLRAR